MTDEKKETAAGGFYLDAYTIIKDILKEWRSILLIVVAALFFAYSYQYLHYSENYTMTTTFTVSSKSTGSSVFQNQRSAEDTVTELTQILNSSILQKKVAQVIGMDTMPGQVTAEVIESTNLVTLKVTESSPELAYNVMHAVMDNYNTVSDSLLHNVVLDVLEESKIPVEPDEAFSPGSGMAKAALVAALLLILFAGSCSALRDTVRREKEVEKKLDTKLIGALPHEDKFKALSSRIHNKQIQLLISNPTVSFRYSESVRKLAARVDSKLRSRKAHILLVTSVLENEGKSTVAANLALALSEQSKRVLLIDGDFRKPSLYKLFRMNPEELVDFGDVLKGNTDKKPWIYDVPGSTLKLICGTRMHSDSTEMIGNARMRRLLKYFKKKTDYVIIDCSPMALVADVEIMRDMADASLLVVSQHNASVGDINDSIDILNGREMKLIGCVFNNVCGENFNLIHGYGGYGGYNGPYRKYGYGYHYDYGVNKIRDLFQKKKESGKDAPKNSLQETETLREDTENNIQETESPREDIEKNQEKTVSSRKEGGEDE